MKKALFMLVFVFHNQLQAIEQLPSSYLVQYGSPQAKLEIVQYFSFTCPYCVAHFRKLFQKIKTDYIETGRVSWIFHPVPMDLLTVQGMDCLSNLSDKEKKVFLEAILEELSLDHPQASAKMMQKAMEILGKPLKNLTEKAYLSETSAFQDAFQFLKQDQTIEAVPSISMNGEFISARVPDIEFIENHLNRQGKHS